MSTLTVNGERVVSGNITFTRWGAWSANIILASVQDFVDAVTLAVGDLVLQGTVVRKGTFAGSKSMRVVAGAGGWRKTLPSRGYSHLAGVKLSSVLGDAARESGERVSIPSDRLLGAHYAREQAPAERVLRLLLDGKWWIDNDGITQLKDRDASPIVTPFTVITWSGGMGQFEIASESIASWQPGRTFAAPTVPGTIEISSVSVTADNEGKLRITVLDGEGERMRESMLAMVRAESPALSYHGVWEYHVAPSVGLGLLSTLDCTSSDPRMPDLTGVPLVGLGKVAAPLTGTPCRIQFVNGDPTRPECIALGGTTEHVMTIEAAALLIYNTWVALLATAGGGPLTAVVLQPLLAPAMSAAIGAQAAPSPPGLIAQTAAAAALQAGFAAGTTPSPAMFAAWTAAIAANDAKTLDVSGAFPGLGVPNG